MDRREFLKAGGFVLITGSGAWGAHLMTLPNVRADDAPSDEPRRKWGMVIDLSKCVPDCDACMSACRNENNVAYHDDERWDIHWVRKVHIRNKHQPEAKAKPVILMCNHCDTPPCAQVCPIQATYKRHDGIVIIDHHRCMGCRYCMIACPYNARFFNYKENPNWPNKQYPKRSHGVAESCNFCAHRLDAQKLPACVEACQEVGANALTIGDLNDPESEVSHLISSHHVKRIREDFGCDPKVYYIGL